ncbi:uncharacterized protein HMPREF1541_07818 [Cyphellophora europaea CBS 101466]|uniref:DUF3752 domain-containing protein n=1 Tax=Cyphellophora europaea (strain CBS 101466) TaxID=1220924 RepID=W2RK32_CYPE1|nr:uncharacterized protein HMPREF1541_07818 [Cyphellophora europaea CBS 101466]ETN36831.1 hypothetical protein HMPREF1541_07818 [Cyphellophora europaea CBS 101466]
MSAVGPSLPPSLTDKRKRDGDDCSDDEASSSPVSDNKRPRVAGPTLPPAPPDQRPSNSVAVVEQNKVSDSESSEDDDFGPALPGAADAVQRTETQPTTKPAAPAVAQRDEWMTMAPAHGDWSARVDPTQLKARKFNTGKGAKAPVAATGASDAWHETPEQKQARLQRELMGIKEKSSTSNALHQSKVTEEDAATAKRLQEYNNVRGPSLYQAHQRKEGKEEDDDPSKRAFDREKDIAGGLQLNSTQRRDMMKKASDFGSRFSSAKYL